MQALIDEGLKDNVNSPSVSPSASQSPSASASPSPSLSVSPSASASPSAKSPSASISPSSSRSPSSSQSPSASISPSSSNSPSISPSSVQTSVFRDLIRSFVDASDGNTYGFGNTGYIYKRDTTGYWSVVHKARSQIKGAAEEPQDSGKTYLMWMLDTEVHCKELPGKSNWNDVDALAGYPKTNLTSADWHTAKEIQGDLLICNGSTLAMIGYDGSYTNNALQLIPGNLAKTLVERSARTIIGTVAAANLTKGVNAAIDTEVPLAQMGKDGEIFFANMVDSLPATRFPGGGQVNPGGVTSEINKAGFFDWDQLSLDFINKQYINSMSLWGVWGGESGKNGIYSYGRKRKNQPFVLNLDYLMNVDEIGAIINIDGLILASYKLGSSFGVMAVDQTRKATGVYEGLDLHAPVKVTAQITVWELAELYLAPLPAGTSVEFWYRVDKTGSFVKANTADGHPSYSVSGGQKAVFSMVAKGEIFEPRIVLNPSLNSAPEVYRARIFFK